MYIFKVSVDETMDIHPEKGVNLAPDFSTNTEQNLIYYVPVSIEYFKETAMGCEDTQIFETTQQKSEQAEKLATTAPQASLEFY